MKYAYGYVDGTEIGDYTFLTADSVNDAKNLAVGVAREHFDWSGETPPDLVVYEMVPVFAGKVLIDEGDDLGDGDKEPDEFSRVEWTGLSKRAAVMAELAGERRPDGVIAEIVGCSRELVRQCRLKEGISSYQRYDWSQIQADLLRCFAEGMTWAEAAAVAGVSVHTAQSRFARKQSPFAMDKQVAKARTEGRTARKIAQGSINAEGEHHCRKCDTFKAPSEFHNSGGTANDGLVRYCKLCASTAARESYQRRKGTVPNPTVDSKTCTRCRKIKEAAAFAQNRNDPTGLQSWCKTCYVEWRLERLGRKK